VRIALARPDQVAELVRLVNDAYAAGEEGLWAGGLERTDEDEIVAAVEAGDMLVATAGGRLAGCARARSIDAETGEVGLVAVAPEAWGSGAGGALLRAAEEHMRARGAATMRLTLLVPRDGEHPFKRRLHDWYTRRGYEMTGSAPIENVLPHVAPHLATPCDLLFFTKPLEGGTVPP
jgi:GNAT superfamily N-acetyltransferase